MRKEIKEFFTFSIKGTDNSEGTDVEVEIGGFWFMVFGALVVLLFFCGKP